MPETSVPAFAGMTRGLMELPGFIINVSASVGIVYTAPKWLISANHKKALISDDFKNWHGACIVIHVPYSVSR